MAAFSAVRCIVEFMDGEVRTYEPIGGATDSPKLTGDGYLAPVLLEMFYKTGEYGAIEHVAAVPLTSIRQYRLEPLR